MFTDLLTKHLPPTLRGPIKRRLLLAVSLLIPLLSSAYDFEVDGIYYTKTSDDYCYVTGYNSYNDISEIAIPKKVTYKSYWSYTEEEYIVEGIGSRAFASSEWHECNIKKITIPQTVKIIGDYAFNGCQQLEELQIIYYYPSDGNFDSIGIESIGAHAFDGCTSLKNLKIDAYEFTSDREDELYEIKTNTHFRSLLTIGEFAFHNCSNLKQMNFWGLHGQGGIANDVSIGAHSFENCSNLWYVGISPDSIPEYAFNNCTNLGVAPTSKAVNIGDYAFCNCYNIGFLDLNCAENIGNYAFYDCGGHNFDNYSFGPNLKTIGSYSFARIRPGSYIYGQKGPKDIIIPASVTHIGDYAFQGDNEGVNNEYFGYGIRSVTFLCSITDVPEGLFEKRNELQEVILSPTITTLGTDAFRETGLDHFDFMNVTTDNGSLRYCKNLKTIIIPSTLKELYSTFSNCTSLESVTLSEGVEKLGSTFYQCTSLVSINLPNSLKEIGGDTFRETGIKEIIIPYGIETLRPDLFYYCTSLREITLPSSINTIYDGVFCGCSNLEKIKLNSSIPPSFNVSWHQSIKYDTFFSGVKKGSCILYVPFDCISVYKKNNIWNNFQNIIELDKTIIPIGEWETICHLKYILCSLGWDCPWNTSGEIEEVSTIEEVHIDDYHITQIDLSNKNLCGIFPWQVFNFPALRELKMDNNSLHGDLAQLMDAHSVRSDSLFYLNLSHNRLSGNVSEIASRCPALTKLNLAENAFRDVNPPLSKTITKLDISRQEVPDTLTLDLDNPFEFLTNLPTILTYNHSAGAYDNLNLTLTAPATEDAAGTLHDAWKVKMSLADGLISFSKSGSQCNYYGQSSDDITLSNATDSKVNTRFFFRGGDTDFDGSIDVADLQSTIKMIFDEQLPKPYNFTAGDLVADAYLNVQDVVSEVSLLMEETHTEGETPEYAPMRTRDDYDALVYCNSDGLVLDARKPVSAFDIVLGENYYDLSYLNRIDGFICDTRKADGRTHIIGYSLSGETLPAGRTILLPAADGNAAVSYAATCDESANKLRTAYGIIATGLAGPDNGILNVTVKDGFILIEGCEGPVSWTISSLDGRILSEGQADASGLEVLPVTVDFDGVVIISLRTSSFTLTKKINLK